MNFDPVKYVKETLSRGEKSTLLGRNHIQDFRPISDQKKWSKVNFSPRDKVSFRYFLGSKFIPPASMTSNARDRNSNASQKIFADP